MVPGALGVNPEAYLAVNLAGFKPMRNNDEVVTCTEAATYMVEDSELD